MSKWVYTFTSFATFDPYHRTLIFLKHIDKRLILKNININIKMDCVASYPMAKSILIFQLMFFDTNI
jgi:hypothetical protein